MNQFVDQFAKQPLSVKIVALVILVALIGAGFYQIWLVPKQEQLEVLEKKSKELQVKVVENQSVADNLPMFQAEVNKLNEELRQAVSLLPNEANIQNILRQLTIVSKKRNVDLLSFRPGGKRGRGFYSELPMDLQLRGTYHDIASFIDDVGKLQRIINISDLVVNNVKTERRSMVLTVDTRATTFMFGGGK